MSMPSQHVGCKGCDYEGYMQYRPITLLYHLENGDTVESCRDFGWCNRCNGIREIEALLDPGELQRQIDSLKPAKKSFRNFMVGIVDRALGGSHYDREELRRLTKLLHIAQVRQFPPRCLACGEPVTGMLTFDHEGTCSNFVHACGGKLYLMPLDTDAPRFFHRPIVIDLSMEGELLR